MNKVSTYGHFVGPSVRPSIHISNFFMKLSGPVYMKAWIGEHELFN